MAKSAERDTGRESYPVLSTRSNFASSYSCLSPPLSSTSTTRVAKLSMPGRLFRPPPSNFQEQAGSWPQKGDWSFRGTLSKTCRSDTSRECSSNLRIRRFEFSQRGIVHGGSIKRFAVVEFLQQILFIDGRFSFFDPFDPTFSFVNSN